MTLPTSLTITLLILVSAGLVLLLVRNFIKYLWREKLWFARRITWKLFLIFFFSLITPICAITVFTILVFNLVLDSLVTKADLVNIEGSVAYFEKEINKKIRSFKLKFRKNVKTKNLSPDTCLISMTSKAFGNCSKQFLAVKKRFTGSSSRLAFYESKLFFVYPSRNHLLILRIDDSLAQNYLKLKRQQDAIADYLKEKRSVVRHLTANLAFVVLLSLFSALWLGVFLGRNFTSFFNRIVKGIDEVSRGNFAFRVEGSSQPPEFYLVSKKFNSMVLTLQSTVKELKDKSSELQAVLNNCGVAIAIIENTKIVYQNVFFSGLRKSLSIDWLLGQIQEVVEQSFQKFQTFPATGSKIAQFRETLFSVFVTILNPEKTKCVVALRDVTNLVQEERNIFLRDLLSRLAHEVRNPLMPIEEKLKALRDSTETVSLKIELESILNQIVEFKRLLVRLFSDVKLQNIQLSSFDICDLLFEVSQAVKPVSKNVDFTAVSKLTSNEVVSDRTVLSIAFKNVLENAFNHATDGSQVKVVLTEDSSFIYAYIYNRGAQIPLELREKIFEPYFTTSAGGTGLGLYLTKILMASMRGEIRLVESTEENTCFCLAFPKSLDKLRPNV